MLSLSRARELLASASDLDALLPIAHELGFTGQARDLDDSIRQALGISDEIAQVRIARGTGGSRVLLIAIAQGSTLKDGLTRTAVRLAARSPHLIWLLVAVDARRTQVAIATISHERQAPQARALVCDRANVIDSDAETLCALASARGQLDVMMQCRWAEILGREALTRRFYRTLERVVDDLALSQVGPLASSDARELALLYTSRLLFLSFLETQGWLNNDHGFLSNGFSHCMATGGRYHRRVLLPLFFGTLNTPVRARSRRALAFGRVPFLNGGLFSRTHLERRAGRAEFTDEALGKLYGDLLCRHRFTPREESTDWSEAAIDPEMLGKAFESLMLPADRKTSGAFYTPHALVERMLREALTHALECADLPRDSLAAVLETRQIPPRARELLLTRVTSIRILDPACGSGAFLVLALRELSWLAQACGDPRRPGDITRSVLVNSIFGVDINPTAVWLCELRLWLTMVMEQRSEGIAAITPLPNLDRQIRVGDTLAGGSFATVVPRGGSAITRLRGRYSRARGARKQSLAKALDHAERGCAIAAVSAELERTAGLRRELVVAARARDLFGARHPPRAEIRDALACARSTLHELRKQKKGLLGGAALPFSFAAHFADASESSGFDLIIGNPPWVRLHRIPPRDRARLRAEFAVFRSSSWESGANEAHAGAGFGSQVDMSALFVERSLHLARPGGIVALLVPAKLWTSLAGGGVREFVSRRTSLLVLEDLSHAPVAFDAAAYPSLLIARRHEGEPEEHLANFAVHRGSAAIRWKTRSSAPRLDGSPGSPWLIAPPEVRHAFEALRNAGIPLARTRLGRPLLGVKSGCNEAFVVSMEDGSDGPIATVRSDERIGSVERALLRPAIKGEHVSAWRHNPGATHVIWTHGVDARPLKALPPDAKRWLAHYRARLERRADARSTDRWWSLFRTEGASCERPRVVWADMGKRPRASVIDQDDPSVPLNTCYVVKCRNLAEALSFAAILNSDIAAAWLSIVAEPARGGYYRYLGWTLALLPLPRDWGGACDALAKVADDQMNGDADPAVLLDAVLRAYGVRFEEIAPLLAWTS